MLGMLEDMRDERLTIIFMRIQARARGKQMRVEFQKMLERKYAQSFSTFASFSIYNIFAFCLYQNIKFTS